MSAAHEKNRERFTFSDEEDRIHRVAKTSGSTVRRFYDSVKSIAITGFATKR
jgi:hypothetical protein